MHAQSSNVKKQLTVLKSIRLIDLLFKLTVLSQAILPYYSTHNTQYIHSTQNYTIPTYNIIIYNYIFTTNYDESCRYLVYHNEN